jgi:hypothetical protein
MAQIRQCVGRDPCRPSFPEFCRGALNHQDLPSWWHNSMIDDRNANQDRDTSWPYARFLSYACRSGRVIGLFL